jgi:hypothetical protein
MSAGPTDELIDTCEVEEADIGEALAEDGGQKSKLLPASAFRLSKANVVPNTNHSIDAPPRNLSWSKYLRPNARADIAHGDASEGKLSRDKEKAMKVCRRNRRNSVRHAKGLDKKTMRPGKGKQDADLTEEQFAFAEEEEHVTAENHQALAEVMCRVIQVRKHDLCGPLPERFKMGQQVKVTSTATMGSSVSYGMAVVTCHGGYKCCCGYKRTNRGIGVTYDDGSKYHCRADQLLISDVPVDECGSDICATKNSSSLEPRAPDGSHVNLSSERFTLIARTMHGKEHLIPNVSVEMTARELKRRIFLCIGIPSRTTQILCGEQILHGRRMIGEQGVTGPEAEVTILRRPMDIKAWNLLLRDLLVAIASNDIMEARHLVEAYIECKGEFRLAHLLQSAYFRINTDIAWFLLENAPAKVLFQALAMNGSRTYSESKLRSRMTSGACPSTSLIGFMYVMGDFEALELVGRRLGAHLYHRLRRQATVVHAWWEDIDYRTGHAWLERGQRITSAPPGLSRQKDTHMSEGDHGQVRFPSKSFEIDWRTKNITFKGTDKQQDGWPQICSGWLAKERDKFRLVGRKKVLT